MLDYNTFQNVKIHDKVTFPYVLNGNDYMHGFEAIPNKQSDKKQEVKEALINPEVGKGVAFDIEMQKGEDTVMKEEQGPDTSPNKVEVGPSVEE